MVAPTLMSLPRELRDMVCSHLYCNIWYQWPWPYFSRHPCKLEVREFVLHNAPIVSVLLVNSQMHNEYQDSIDSHRVSATIITGYSARARAVENRIYNKNSAQDAFLLIHDLSLFASPSIKTQFWRAMTVLAENLVSDAPKLETLQMVRKLADMDPMLLPETSRLRNQDPYTGLDLLLPTAPQRLPGEMSPIRHGEGFRLGYAEKYTLGGWEKVGRVNKDTVWHDVVRVGIYGYTKTGSIEALIGTRDVVEIWPMPRYTRHVLELLGEEGERVQTWPDEFMEWIEKE
ncbi:hypothetical protein CC86DRAFT_104314 [Ophiobolus disseminans]|uniref:F-box domain-containing protein n=1 Tax=Ophiobolus disseminans TaxID=1469910 RepID=A0A6A6ZKG7_9PLEO|nr:hypothetical protein CC86DRAFT_104314 [Ophiobolus disseminans]